MISLACQNPRPKQKGTAQYLPPVGFVSKMQSATLHNKLLIVSDDQEMTF